MVPLHPPSKVAQREPGGNGVLVGLAGHEAGPKALLKVLLETVHLVELADEDPGLVVEGVQRERLRVLDHLERLLAGLLHLAHILRHVAHRGQEELLLALHRVGLEGAEVLGAPGDANGLGVRSLHDGAEEGVCLVELGRELGDDLPLDLVPLLRSLVMARLLRLLVLLLLGHQHLLVVVVLRGRGVGVRAQVAGHVPREVVLLLLLLASPTRRVVLRVVLRLVVVVVVKGLGGALHAPDVGLEAPGPGEDHHTHLGEPWGLLPPHDLDDLVHVAGLGVVLEVVDEVGALHRGVPLPRHLYQGPQLLVPVPLPGVPLEAPEPVLPVRRRGRAPPARLVVAGVDAPEGPLADGREARGVVDVRGEATESHHDDE